MNIDRFTYQIILFSYFFIGGISFFSRQVVFSALKQLKGALRFWNPFRITSPVRDTKLPIARTWTFLRKTPRIHPLHWVRSVLIEVNATNQSNRVLANKTP